MSRVLLLLISFLCLSSVSRVTKHLEYDIIYGSKNIGHIFVDEIHKGDTTKFNIISEVDYHSFLISYQRTTSLNAVFYKDDFLYAKNEIVKGGDLDERTVTTKKNGYYLLENLEEEDEKLTKAIGYTTSRLYTIEPENVNMVYCEGYQQFCSIEKTGNHQYKLHLPDNKTNEYFYEDGKLVLVKIHRTLVSLTFKLRQ